MQQSSIPKTRFPVAPEEAERIRSVVRETTHIPGPFGDVRVAAPADAPALARLISHETIAPRLSTMPPVIDARSMLGVIEDHLMEKARGEGVFFGVFNPAGEALAYFDVLVWPEWGACKFGGAVTPARQGRGFGASTTIAAIDWCFHVLGVARICETTALDNDRSNRLLSRLGFVRMGEVTAIRPDGSPRPSAYWEMERDAWSAGFRRAG